MNASPCCGANLKSSGARVWYEQGVHQVGKIESGHDQEKV
jgi:hypothetical protein